MKKLFFKVSVFVLCLLAIFYIDVKLNKADAQDLEQEDDYSFTSAIVASKTINQDMGEVNATRLYDMDANIVGILIEPISLDQYYIYLNETDSIVEYSLNTKSSYSSVNLGSNIYIYEGFGDYGIYDNGKIYDIVNDAYYDLETDNFSVENGISDIFPADEHLYTDTTIKIKEKRIENSWYFENNFNNLPENEQGTCGYVAISMLLAYYDFFKNDNIVDEDLILNTIRNDIDIQNIMLDLYLSSHSTSRDHAAMVLFGPSAQVISNVTYSSSEINIQDVNRVPGATETLHYFLQYIGSTLGYGTGTWASDLDAILENYFNNYTDKSKIGNNSFLFGRSSWGLLGPGVSQLDANNPIYICVGNTIAKRNDGTEFTFKEHVVPIYGYELIQREKNGRQKVYYIAHTGWTNNNGNVFSEVYLDCSIIGSYGYIHDSFIESLGTSDTKLRHETPDGDLCETYIDSSYDILDYFTYHTSIGYYDYFKCKKCDTMIGILAVQEYKYKDENTHIAYGKYSGKKSATEEHDFKYIQSVDSDTHQYVCSHCGYVKEEEHQISYDEYHYGRCDDCYEPIILGQYYKELPNPVYVNLTPSNRLYKMTATSDSNQYFFTTSKDATIYQIDDYGPKKLSLTRNENGSYYKFKAKEGETYYFAISTPANEYVRIGFVKGEYYTSSYIYGTKYITRGSSTQIKFMENSNIIDSSLLTYKTKYDCNSFGFYEREDGSFVVNAFCNGLIDDKITVIYYAEGVCDVYSLTIYVISDITIEAYPIQGDGQISFYANGLNENEGVIVNFDVYDASTNSLLNKGTFDLGTSYYYDNGDGDAGIELFNFFYLLDLLPSLQNKNVHNVVIKFTSVKYTSYYAGIIGSEVLINTVHSSSIPSNNEMITMDDINLTLFFRSGLGTEDDPYVITSFRQLFNIRYMSQSGIITGYYTIENNIGGFFYASNYTTFDWNPITTFAGVLDGGNHSINSFSINKTDVSDTYMGLFGTLTGTVKNLKMEYVNIAIDDVQDHTTYFGAIAGNNQGTISNCYVTGKMNIETNDSYTGSIAGINSNGLILNCTSYIGITSYGSVGGIVGKDNSSSAISGLYCNYYYGTINYIPYSITNDSDNASIGGIVGYGEYMDTVYYSSFSGIINCDISSNNKFLAPRVGGIYGTLECVSYRNKGYMSGRIDSGSLRTIWSWFTFYDQLKYVNKTGAVGKQG